MNINLDSEHTSLNTFLAICRYGNRDCVAEDAIKYIIGMDTLLFGVAEDSLQDK